MPPATQSAKTQAAPSTTPRGSSDAAATSAANADGTYPYFFFYGHTPSNPVGVLSQWHETGFVDLDSVIPCHMSDKELAALRDAGLVDGDGHLYFKTAEHYMMCRKAQLFHPTSIAPTLRARSPRDAKRLGRSIPNFVEEVWNLHADDIVEHGNYCKFSQNPNAWAVLRDTRGPGPAMKTCVEASRTDAIWGIGFNAAHARGNEELWGNNRLGKALTRVRDRLLAERGDEQ